MGSIKGVSHLSKKAKRRLCCRINLWMWRKRWKNCFLRILMSKRRASRTRSNSGPHQILNMHSKINKRPQTQCTLNHTPAVVPLLCATEHRGQTSLLNPCETDGVSEALKDSSYLENHVTDTNAAAGAISQTANVATENFIKCCEIADASELLQTRTESDECGNIRYFEVPGKVTSPQRLEVKSPTKEEQVSSTDKDERISSKKSSQADVSLADMTKNIHEFLHDFYRCYGSFIPLQKSDIFRHLNRTFNMNFSDRKNVIISEVIKYQTVVVRTPVPAFQVNYKKHKLTLDDLLTLADQNWLNDQIMNMYGELIMESVNQKVHFLNSFFHRQLMTKGYDGVKRWTKQIDLFSKSLLLVPIHLEVHWCLVTADIVKKRICLYDSQGNALQKVARNILKYLMAEAKEKQQTAFENNWTVVYNEKIPQQTNENDCGVFVLEYCRCLALSKPLQFSQNDIPKIRKRIYKELCDCKLLKEG